ncbi:MAG: tRNA (guanosine(46)-N7)-methyltransferase TrmB [Flavobacteriales bacterium]
MAKNKLRKWSDMSTLPHVFQASGKEWITNDHELKGHWNKNVFKNQHPIIIELGCGRGEYTIGLAKKFPEKNFIGIDIKGARMWNGAMESFQHHMPNVAFLRTRIDFINSFFAPDEVDEIWLTFSDPQPRKENKRLTSSLFIDKYKRLLKKNGIIHVKTDSDLLYAFTLAEIMKHNYQLHISIADLYRSEIHDEELKSILHIRTFYEEMWLAKDISIKYIKFGL